MLAALISAATCCPSAAMDGAQQVVIYNTDFKASNLPTFCHSSPQGAAVDFKDIPIFWFS